MSVQAWTRPDALRCVTQLLSSQPAVTPNTLWWSALQGAAHEGHFHLPLVCEGKCLDDCRPEAMHKDMLQDPCTGLPRNNAVPLDDLASKPPGRKGPQLCCIAKVAMLPPPAGVWAAATPPQAVVAEHQGLPDPGNASSCQHRHRHRDTRTHHILY